VAQVKNQCEAAQIARKDSVIANMNSRLKELEQLLINQSRGEVQLWVKRYLQVFDECTQF
jgi:hypothetical protein